MDSIKRKSFNANVDLIHGPIFKSLIIFALPLFISNIFQQLYNTVDTMIVGNFLGDASLAAIGSCTSIYDLLVGFALGIGNGLAIVTARSFGSKDEKLLKKSVASSLVIGIVVSIGLTLIGLIFLQPLLHLLNTPANIIDEAYSYIFFIVLFIIVMFAYNLCAGLMRAIGNSVMPLVFLVVSSVLNIILDPLFIFVLHMNVKGAAIATVISQGVSALWTLQFLTGKQTILKLRKKYFKLNFYYVKRIFSLGTAGFMMGITNSVVTIVCNSTLQTYGGDLYIAIMTIINSIREIAQLPGQGMANACQPVLGYNYGAKEYKRVLTGIKFVTIVSFIMMFVIWLAITLFPEFFIQIFTHNQKIISHGITSLHLYFFGFFMMTFQMVGQSTAVGLGKSKQAIFFSIFRKVIIVAPLTIILPKFIDINGVFIAEAISNFIGGGACYITMWLTIGRKLQQKCKEEAVCIPQH